MSIPQSIILGIIQGITEWLPISSSGHLVIAQEFFERIVSYQYFLLKLNKNMQENINFPKEVTENFLYDFKIDDEGLYLIEIIANAKSWWQNLKRFRAFFDDDDLAVKIDGIEFLRLGGKRGLFDGEAAWNGNNLKGLKKTAVFILNLDKGLHKIEFVADQKPIIHSIGINKLDEAQIEYIPMQNKQAEDGNGRQWITIAISDLPLQNLEISARAEKREKDCDDIKLIIDGEIQQNPDSKYFKNWYWCGSIDDAQVSGASKAPDPEKETWKEFQKETNLPKGLHYIEFWADRMPALERIRLRLKHEEEEKEKELPQKPPKRLPSADDPKWTGDFYDDTEQMILARAIFGEARSTLLSDEARIAVGWTIRNRVELQAWWGKNYHEVILKPKQYSCFLKTDDNYEIVIAPLSAKSIIDRKAWPKCYEIAGKILKNEATDPVSGATCYHDISFPQEKFITEIVPCAKFIKKIDRLMFYYSPD